MPATALPTGPPSDAPLLALRDFALFSHRRIADDLVRGEGVYLDTVLAQLSACGNRAGDIAWLRQLASDTSDTNQIAEHIARRCTTSPSPAQSRTPAPLLLLSPLLDMQAAWEPQWRALLHYRADGDGGWRSEADLPAFFISAHGKHSPEAELRANIAAVNTGVAGYGCAFPARFAWLVARFKLTAPAPDCPELARWSAGFAGQRISINFASSFLENPSSMFGHTFLKVYGQSNRELLSPTINYAARTEARVNEFDFVRKGLFGGFPGAADELPFYRRLRSYTEDEGRDIWEYELNLTAGELRMLLLHLWEVRSGVFNYYFFDENCAYRTLALLDVARPGAGLLRQYSAVTAPVDTVRTLQAAGMTGARTLWPAFPKQVRRHEAELSAGEVHSAEQIAAGTRATGAASAVVLRLAYEHLSVRINRDQAERTTRKATINTILRARLALAPSAAPEVAAAAAPPETGHDGSSVALGRTGNAATFAWAGFQHTLTDRLAGYEANAEVTVLRPEVRIVDGEGARLERIDWLVVQSTLPGSSLFPRAAWGVRLATARRDFADGRHVSTSLGVSSGRAWPLGDAVLALMPGISLEAGRRLEHKAAAVGTLALLLTRQSAWWSGQLELQTEKMVLGDQLFRSAALVRSTVALSRNSAIEFNVRQSFRPRRETEAGVALKLYFRPLAFLPQQ